MLARSQSAKGTDQQGAASHKAKLHLFYAGCREVDAGGPDVEDLQVQLAAAQRESLSLAADVQKLLEELEASKALMQAQLTDAVCSLVCLAHTEGLVLVHAPAGKPACRSFRCLRQLANCNDQLFLEQLPSTRRLPVS